MFLLNWYRELLQIRDERVCQSCEYFKLQIESLQHRNEQLVRQLTQTDVPPVPVQTEAKEPIRPRFIPWRTRRQMLEQEDAKAAQVMRAKQKEIQTATVAPSDDPDVRALEAEMEIIEKERTDAGQVS